MRSLVESPTRIVSSVWAGANAAIVDPGAAVLRRAASASYGAKNGLGRRTLGGRRCGEHAGLARDADLAGGRVAAERRVDGLDLPADGRVERQLERLPVEVVPDLQPAIDDIEWRVEPAGTGDRPAGGVARHRALLGADHRPTREDS